MKIKNIFGLALATAALLPIASCTDGNDWETDSSHDRLFGVKSSNLGVETDDNAPTKATVTFSPYDKDGQYYIIEVSRDSLYDDVPMGGENAVVYGQDKSITSSPVEITGLLEYTQYYLRMKVMSDTKAESKWVYYKSGASFRTPGILKEVSDDDRLDTSVRLTWIAGSNVTHIVYTTNVDDEPVSNTVNLTADDIAAAEYTVEGLTPNKTYTFEIYNGDVLLGSVKLKTAKGVPAADVVYYVNESVITTDLLAQLAEQAKTATQASIATISLGITAGADVELGTSAGGVHIPDGVSVTFFGRAGARANLKIQKSMSFDGNAGFVSFEHVNIDGLYDAENGVNGSQYLINQSDAAQIDSIGFTECSIANFQNALLRMQSKQTIRMVSVDNCTFNNHGGAYALFCFDKNGTQIDNISLKNSTFSNVCGKNKAFIDLGYSKNSNVNVQSCTFYNLLGSGAYLLSAKNASGIMFNLDKVLLAKTQNEGARGYQTSSTVTVNATTCFATSDFVLGAGKFKDGTYTTMSESSSSVFKSPADLDFTVKSTELQLNAVGDPRWLE